MAQIILNTLRAAAFVFVSMCAAAAAAQTPDAALKAEAESRWDDAIRLHQAAIQADASRADLWVRIADIEARRGNLNACVDALNKAAAAAPGDASIYHRLSQAYSKLNQPLPALKAVEGALALQPKSAEYLRARAILATWLADYDRARQSYRELSALDPDDVDMALAYARVSAWSGDTDEAVAQYERYLHKHPQLAEGWIELARAESWRGNYAAALRALARYRAGFGETAEYSQTYAAVMTGAGRPGRAEAMTTPLLAQTPDDLQLNLTRTIALAMQQRAREAFSSLDTVRQLAPESRDTRDAERLVRTMLASTVEPAFTVYSDSDRLQIQRFAPHGTFALVTGTQFSAGYERSRLTARRGSGLDAIDGAADVDYQHSWVGVAQKLGRVTVGVQGGYAKPAADEFVTYSVGATTRATDTLQFSLQRSSSPVVISPRTVSIGLTQIGHRAQVEWSPTLQSMVVFDGQVADFSDGNRRLELTLAPRRSFARTAGFNLDLGMSAYRLETRFDLADGYYDPKRYEHYGFTAFPYFKFSENVGLSLSSALGVQRDSRSPQFRFGGTMSGEATFGIYEPWVLKINGSASLNRRLESGAFRGLSGGVVLVRRF
jgi:cytochrome c-type biogenesis protein CcmH/NrfG